MTIDIDHLEAAAIAATPGPWRTSRKYGEHDDLVRTEWSTQSKKIRDVLVGGTRAFGRDHRGHIRIIEAIGPQWEANAAFIAAANPAVVLELIAMCRHLRWTTETPTEPGWYWNRSGAWPPEILRLYYDSDNELCYTVNGVGDNCWLVEDLASEPGCEWAGPIPKPQEPK